MPFEEGQRHVVVCWLFVCWLVGLLVVDVVVVVVVGGGGGGGVSFVAKGDY